MIQTISCFVKQIKQVGADRAARRVGSVAALKANLESRRHRGNSDFRRWYHGLRGDF